MELPFAVESPERTSQLLSPTGNDGSSLVTTSSQGSFFESSTTSGFHNTNQNNMTGVHNPHLTANNHMTATMMQQQQQQQQRMHQHQHRQQQQQHVTRQHQQPMLHHAPPVVSPPAAPPQRPTPSTTTSGGGLTSGLNIFGSLRVPSVLSSKSKQQQQQQPAVVDATSKPSLETIDFTYVNVCETDADEVDITLDGQHTAMDGLQGMLGGEDGETLNTKRGDVLALLLSGVAQQQDDSQNEALVRQCEEANQAACDAIEAKRDGELQRALEAHSQSAKQFREAALLIKDRNMSMANSLLLLSQTQAKSALALKRIVKQQSLPHDSNAPGSAKNPRSKIITQKDRLRAAVRGALVTRNEAEMSDSAFLGRATKGPMTTTTSPSQAAIDSNSRTTSSQSHTSSSGHAHHNPVDDMMELERELRDMDMALELGNSIASLDARTQNRLKNSFGVDGSFMVVPPGSQSYMSSSNMWSPSPATGGGGTNQRNSNNKQRTTSGNTSVRARANRVQNLVGANPRSPPHGIQQQQPQHLQQQSQPQQQNRPPAAGLESSWWGNSSTTSQVLASSVISLGASSMRGGVGGEVGGSSGGTLDPNASSANTKQLMRLMDALKTLGDENANLLREVEEAEAARMEAKAAKEQMAKFKSEYGKRFENLKAALEKFRKGYPENGPVASGSNSTTNPVTNSEFMRTASNTEQLQRQEQLIRKLTADLKKEKEESKKKDQALRKYESFYREVKARSAQKAAQRQREAAGAHPRPPQPQSHGGTRRAGHR